MLIPPAPRQTFALGSLALLLGLPFVAAGTDLERSASMEIGQPAAAGPAGAVGAANPLWSVSWSPDGQRLASASHDYTVKVWDARTGQESLTLKGHTARVFGVAFGPDGHRLASASWYRTVKIWDARPLEDETKLAENQPSK